MDSESKIISITFEMDLTFSIPAMELLHEAERWLETGHIDKKGFRAIKDFIIAKAEVRADGK